MEGYGAKEIVTHYYKGTSVGTIADTVGSDSFLRTKNRPVWVGLPIAQDHGLFPVRGRGRAHRPGMPGQALDRPALRQRQGGPGMEGAGRRQGRMPGAPQRQSRLGDKGQVPGRRHLGRAADPILLSGTGYTYARGCSISPVPGKKRSTYRSSCR